MLRLASFAALFITGSVAVATPTVTGNTITWPDDGWYQVLDERDYSEVCGGARSCTVAPGSYAVINHSAGVRYSGVIVGQETASPIVVTGNTISWPNNGWYQVLDESDYSEVCGGTTSCVVAPGSYAVINHSSGSRYSGIVVGEDTTSAVEVNGNTISWPNDGWYQLLDERDYREVCGGTLSCVVQPGSYSLINHSTSMRWNNIVVGDTTSALTFVDFDITVPAYQSNELRVEVNWGDTTLNVGWVGDEYWTASTELPTESENILSVTFYDRNGGIELARFTQSLSTGTSAAKTIQVTAEQFDSEQFDADEDGVSNLDELIAGTNPLDDEFTPLEIFDYFELSAHSRMSASRTFESRLSEERPLFISESNPSDSPSTYENIDIDAEGNGTLYYSSYRSYDQLKLRATRTHSGNSITWEGSREAYDGDYTHRVNFTNTVTVADDNTRSFVEEHTGTNIGTYNYSWQTSANVTGTLIEGTSYCTPVAGTIFMSDERRPNYTLRETTVSKEIGDRYWKVVTVNQNNETSEYLVRDLVILGYWTSLSPETPQDRYFKCEFADI